MCYGSLLAAGQPEGGKKAVEYESGPLQNSPFVRSCFFRIAMYYEKGFSDGDASAAAAGSSLQTPHAGRMFAHG
jgi:hypothetical protein